MSEKQLHVRVSEVEMEALERYAQKTKRTKTDIVREFLRSLDSAALRRRGNRSVSHD